MKDELVTCPRCASTEVRPLGNAGSPLSWYTCRGCHHVWFTGVPSQQTPTVNLQSRIADGKCQQILVVDDDLNTLALIQRALAEYRVSVVQDGLQALQTMAVSGPFDLLITDYLMPGMTGLELVRRARAAQPALNVLVMTGYQNAVAFAEPEWRASEQLLAKPLRIEALRRAVEALIGPPSAAASRPD